MPRKPSSCGLDRDISGNQLVDWIDGRTVKSVRSSRATRTVTRWSSWCVAHHPVGSNPTLTATARTRWKRYSCVESRVTIDRDEGGVRFSTGSCVNTTGPIGWKRKPIPRVCTRRTASSSTRPSTPILLTPSGRFFSFSLSPLPPLLSYACIEVLARFSSFSIL